MKAWLLGLGLALSVSVCANATSESDVKTTLIATLTKAGLTTPIKDVRASVVGQLWQVHLVGAEPIFVSKDGRYVLQGVLEANPSPKVAITPSLMNAPTKAGQSVSDEYRQALLANMKALKNLNADSAFFYTNIQGLLWGVSGIGGVPFLVSDDGRYFINGEISVIKDGRFAGLDTDFEWTKNHHVLSSLDENTLTIYPAKAQKALIYVATDIHCPYCRVFHGQIDALNAQGITVKVIGYPVYDESYEPMRQIWCKQDNDKRAKLLSLAMKGIRPKNACQGDTNFLTKNQKQAQALAVIATPAIYRADGVLFEGDFHSDSKELVQFLGLN